MEHLKVELKCVGDKITAISEAQKLVKSYGKLLYLNCGEYTIAIRPESDIQDLINIMMLEEKVIKLNKPK